MRLKMYDICQKLQYNLIGPFYRNLGIRMLKAGITLQGEEANQDRLVPSLRQLQYKDTVPQTSNATFVAPNSVIIGSVQLGSKSSIWYSSTLRGDIGQIKIGDYSIVQDLCVIKPSSQGTITLDNNVVVSSKANLSDCHLHSNVFVGLGATVAKGCVIEGYGVLAAGAVLSPNTTIKASEVWAGNPAYKVRDLQLEEKQAIQEYHQELLQLAKIHSYENEKSFRDYINDRDAEFNMEHGDFMSKMDQFLRDINIPVDKDDRDYIEQRVFLNERNSYNPEYHWRKEYDNYETDYFNYPENFKIYGENYKRYQEIEQYFEQNPNQDQIPNPRMEQIMPNQQSKIENQQFEQVYKQ